MDIEEIRRRHINYWADRLGRNILASKIGYKDTVYINQLCRGHGSFGSRTARKIEKALRLPRGAFDLPPAETIKAVNQNAPEGLPLLAPNQAVLWKEDKLQEPEASEARRLGEHEMQNAGFKLMPQPGDRAYLLRYTGPVLLQFGIPRSPILLLIDPDKIGSYPSTVWLINGRIRIGIHQEFDEHTEVLDFLDPVQGKHKIDLNADKLLGWHAGLIFPPDNQQG